MTTPKSIRGFVKVAEYAAAEGISRGRAYQLIALGLPNTFFGGIRMIQLDKADQWRRARLNRVGRPRLR